jgi:MinD-like ATPase involved in chromosome partitioning or flagellar assembly
MSEADRDVLDEERDIADIADTATESTEDGVLDEDTGPIRVIAAAPAEAAAPAQPFVSSFTTAQPQVPQGGRPVGRMPAADDLGLIRRTKPVPSRGWRKVVHRMSGGTVSFGAPEDPAAVLTFTDRSIMPLGGAFSIAVLSLKGGVGKTTTTVGLGATFASMRGDRVIAVDANPDFGTLAQRGSDETRSTVRDLLADGGIVRYSDVRRHTSQSSSRLEILASERDPAASEAFSEADYRATHDILQRFYNIILTDCGTGLMHSAMTGVLDTTDTLVLVASPAIDSVRSALATLDWLNHHGYARLVPHARLVISSARPGAMAIDIDKLAAHFLPYVRAIFVLPFDDHLAQGSEISLDHLGRKTRQTFVDIAASIATDFGRATPRPRPAWI